MRTPRRDFACAVGDMDLASRLELLAVAAADLIAEGMTVGLGTGSTADAVIRELGRRTAAGLSITGVATSCRTETLARGLGIPLLAFDDLDHIDLGFDGADEIDPQLDAIKGRGGALLREKLVALSCDRYVLVATTEKNVSQLGERTALPVEVVDFGWRQTVRRLEELGIIPNRRADAADPSKPWRTDNGGVILDCATGPIVQPWEIAAAVKAVSGVVDHGLFLGLADIALQVDPAGVIVRRER
jgi:ribose 5-phosphate isomerase A